jgi:hypothetical protein
MYFGALVGEYYFCTKSVSSVTLFLIFSDATGAKIFVILHFKKQVGSSIALLSVCLCVLAPFETGVS